MSDHMTELETKAHGFIEQCVEQLEEECDRYSQMDVHYRILILLTYKVFELEEQIKELKNVQ